MSKIFFTFGQFTIELKSFKVISGHDDTLPFVGNMYANGKKIAECMNDGWGGDAMITPNPKYKTLYDEVEKVVKESMLDGFKATMPYVADMLACKMEDQRMLDNNCKKYLMFRESNGHEFGVPILNGITRRNMKIADVMSTASGKISIRAIVTKYCNKGCVCLNDNIGDLNK